MACTPAVLVDDAKCLATGMADHQLLASIAYQLAVSAGVDPTSANLVAQSKCLAQGMSDRQLLAAIAWLQCQLAGG